MAWLDDSEPEERDEQDVDEQKPTRLTAFYIALALVPLLVLFDYLGRFDLGLSIFICLFVNVLAIRIRWRLRKYPWFWGAMGVVTAVELPVILLIRWPPQWVPAVVLLPIAAVAYLVAAGALQLAEKLFGKPTSAEGR
jgi:hypothetical protein